MLHALESNNTLRILDISRNRGRKEVATALRNLIGINTTLQKLEFDGNRFTLAQLQVRRMVHTATGTLRWHTHTQAWALFQ